MRPWSTHLHLNRPLDLYPHVRVPYRTIVFAFFLFVFGVVFLTMGLSEFMQTRSFTQSPLENHPPPYEKLLLGTMIFIPGVYHVVLAICACLRVEGFKYEDVAAFESNEWWEDSNKD
mmetsp:Transcript_16129/g.27278  ORF Transcript_16129/g.27278 Transcript_16129/m.27278 type:complete len:117 (-) Transcript_16129:84-434(-)